MPQTGKRHEPPRAAMRRFAGRRNSRLFYSPLCSALYIGTRCLCRASTGGFFLERIMQPRFAAPTERDLRFVRNSGFRSEDFGQEVRIVSSAVDGVVLGALLIGLLSLLAVAS